MPDYKSNSFRDDQSSRPSSNHIRRIEPPMSRLFVIASKQNTEEDICDAFDKYGDIQYVWFVKEKNATDHKGIAYVKFAKTSEAAKAQEALHGKRIANSERPIKVVVSASKDQGTTDNEPERYVRLFIVVSKNVDEEDITAEFQKYGDVDSVSILHDRNTGASKGFAYVKFGTFYHAALALENCPAKYRAVFAEPKAPRNRDGGLDGGRDDSNSWGKINNNSHMDNASSEMASFMRMNTYDQVVTTLDVICSNALNQDQLWRLFDIVPGLDYCRIVSEDGPRTNEVIVAYKSPEAAIYAKEKIHGLSYPIGERMIVKFSVSNGMNDEPKALQRNQNSICSVNLPPSEPMAPSDAPVAHRLFIVLSSSIPLTILKNVFCTFGNLIDVYLLPNRNCGYVKYAEEDSAVNARDTLNGAEICSTRIKVVDAEEPGDSNRKRMRHV